MEMFLVLLAASMAFVLSASAGLGGSLILVPALALLLGSKEGIALAGLLLAANNVAKTGFYWSTIPWRESALILLAILVGTAVGSSLLVAAPTWLVDIAVVTCLVSAFALERWRLKSVRVRIAPLLGFGSGVASGFSGTSGPLKGVAIRSLDLDRLYFVGAASIISLAGDAMKSVIFAKAELLTGESLMIVVAAIPVMICASYLGRKINRAIGERAFATLFWTIMGGYAVRLVFV